MCCKYTVPWKFSEASVNLVYNLKDSSPFISLINYFFQEKFIKDVKSLSIITDVERKQIVKAIGMKPGHWYKCPNGHFYVITECGGAMQVGKCNECGDRIGGQNHNLLTTNRHAPEMDNSRFPAWSEAANMANFDLMW
ncbi:NFX1-type zinc finger-containing protein 1 [Blattella germanica]|nr:NFX1-type zinc finger-containing protein 1 [Blattella germanica]